MKELLAYRFPDRRCTIELATNISYASVVTAGGLVGVSADYKNGVDEVCVVYNSFHQIRNLYNRNLMVSK